MQIDLAELDGRVIDKPADLQHHQSRMFADIRTQHLQYVQDIEQELKAFKEGINAQLDEAERLVQHKVKGAPLSSADQRLSREVQANALLTKLEAFSNST